MKKSFFFLLIAIMSFGIAMPQGNTPCTASPILCTNITAFGIPTNNFQTTIPPNLICQNLPQNPTTFYRINIRNAGQFTFLIRPGIDFSNNGLVDPNEITATDFDWAVWVNTPCDQITQNANSAVPARISFASLATNQFITGLSVPLGIGNCENANANPTPGGILGLLSPIQVNVGDQIIIAVSDFSNGQAPFQIVIGGINGGGGNALPDLSYDLTDATGVSRSQYCIGESPIYTGLGGASSSYTVDLLSSFGGLLDNANVTNSNPNSVNILNHFPNYNFQINTNYQVRLRVSSACGDCYEVVRPFNFVCCDNSTDASFSLKSNEHPRLSGTAVGFGNHNWQIYGISPITGNIESNENLLTSNEVILSSNLDGRCFFVKHTITNQCGTACSSQRFCTSDCLENSCNLTRPINLRILNGNELTWDPVIGAGSYAITISVCDPNCCGGPIGSSNNAPIIITVPYPSTSHQLSPSDFSSIGFEGLIPCFSWRVHAICNDGQQSMVSDPICFGTELGATCSVLPSLPRYSDSKTLNIVENHILQKGMVGLDVFPNPASSNVNFKISVTTDTYCNISVFDNLGREVKTVKGVKTNNHNSNIFVNTEDLNKGIYLVKVTTLNNDVVSGKLIIE
jgi:hypothetical protein